MYHLPGHNIIPFSYQNIIFMSIFRAVIADHDLVVHKICSDEHVWLSLEVTNFQVYLLLNMFEYITFSILISEMLLF